MKYIGDIFKSLLDTSATKVDIFWMSLNLAKGDSPGMYGILLMKYMS